MARAIESPTLQLGPALDFLQRLWRLNHALETVSSRMEKQIGVTAQQRLIIRFVGQYPGMSAGQLAAVLHVDPATVSAALGRLEQKRLIERRRDPADSRRVALWLSRKGCALDSPTPGTVEEAVTEMLAISSLRESRAAIGLLERLAALLEKAGTDSFVRLKQQRALRRGLLTRSPRQPSPVTRLRV